MSELSFTIKENSILAKIAGYVMRLNKVAIVFGKTIHLYNCKKEDFLANEKWFRHELCHIRQYERYGFINFIFQYLWESIKKGYKNNKFEVEARVAEYHEMPIRASSNQPEIIIQGITCDKNIKTK